MDNSPYLQALQKIPGSTRGDKCRTLTTIARDKIQTWNYHRLPIEVYPFKQLPEPLVPWVKLEIGRILEQPFDIVVGLLSDDRTIFFRALKTKWFFRRVGTYGYPDDEYFKNYIFPCLSLRHRNKVIKTLAANLTDPKIAESFYNTTTELYGFDQARPFLKNCHESFIWSCIYNYKVRLTLKEMKYIYPKNPSFIIQYLHRQNDDDFKYENSSTSNIPYDSDSKENLRKFLPRLLKNHSAEFTLLIQEYNDLQVLLKNNKTKLFLKEQRQTLLNNPLLYFPMLSLQKVTFLLSREEFKTIFQQYFPLDVSKFKFMDVYILLDFMPQSEKLPLILETFRATYGRELEDYEHCVISALKYFPLEERHEQARRLISRHQNEINRRQDIEEWRCYLPLHESVPMIKIDVESCRSHRERVRYLEQLISLCAMNEDFEAMLNVLMHMCVHYPYMEDWEWVKIFDKITREFDFEQYIPVYWKKLYDFILNSEIRTGTCDSVETIWNIIVWGIRMDLESGNKITEKIVVLTEINEINNHAKPIWNICKDNALFEHKCLDEFIDTIFLIYDKHQENNTDEWKNAVVSLVAAMYDFNHRHKSKFNQIMQPFLVEECVWLHKDINNLLRDYFDQKDDFDYRELITLLKENEPHILTPFLALEDFLNIPAAILILKKDICRILCCWETCYKACKKNINHNSTRLFLEHIKWSQHLSRRFLEKCLLEIKKKFDKRIMKMLAILLEGSALGNIINTSVGGIPANTVQEVLDPRPNIVRIYYPIFWDIVEAIKHMNSPFLLVCIKDLCEPEFIPIIAKYLSGLERVVPVNVLIDFFKSFQPMSNSVIKHVVRIFQSAASSNDLQHLLLNLWKNFKKDTKMRTFLTKNIHHAFITRPTNNMWRMMLQCLNDLNSNDEVDTFDIIAHYKKVNDPYLEIYIQKVLSIFSDLEAQSNVSRIPSAWCYIPDLIGSFSVRISNIFSEELHEVILKFWFTDVTADPRVIKSTMNYFVNCYIMPARNDLLRNRLQFFSEKFKEMLRHLSENNSNRSEDFIFINKFFREYINYVVFEMPFNETKQLLVSSTLDSFTQILTPDHDREFYCYLQLTNMFDEQISPRRLADRIDETLEILVPFFSITILYTVAHYLHNLIRLFYHDQNPLFDIIDRLLEHQKRDNTFLATALMLKMTAPYQESNERYEQVLRFHNDMYEAAHEVLLVTHRNI